MHKHRETNAIEKQMQLHARQKVVKRWAKDKPGRRPREDRKVAVPRTQLPRQDILVSPRFPNISFNSRKNRNVTSRGTFEHPFSG
jgi:hypothetical protein